MLTYRNPSFEAHCAPREARHARAETRAAFNHVRVQSAGPWGAAAGVRGHLRVRQFEIAPEARGRIVPPLSGTIVPPLTGPMIPPLTGGPRAF